MGGAVPQDRSRRLVGILANQHAGPGVRWVGRSPRTAADASSASFANQHAGPGVRWVGRSPWTAADAARILCKPTCRTRGPMGGAVPWTAADASSAPLQTNSRTRGPMGGAVPQDRSRRLVGILANQRAGPGVRWVGAVPQDRSRRLVGILANQHAGPGVWRADVASAPRALIPRPDAFSAPRQRLHNRSATHAHACVQQRVEQVVKHRVDHLFGYFGVCRAFEMTREVLW